MRKILCIILAGFILLSFTACGIATKESKSVSDDFSKNDGDETTITTETDPSETTKKPYTQAPKNTDFDDFEIVVGKVFASLGEGYDNLQYQSAEAAEKNERYGIRNMAHIWRGEYHASDKQGGPDRFLRVEILVIQYDTHSDQYHNLKIGDNIEIYMDFDNCPAIVTAQNGQYVISLYASEGYDMLLADIVETKPEFKLGNLQNAYDAFKNIDPNTPNNADYDAEEAEKDFKDFELLVDKVLAALGPHDYRNMEYQDNKDSVKNRNIGIRNMVHIWRGESDLDGPEIIWEFDVNVWIFEFDTESKEYKELKEGGKVFYYERECPNSSVITAINGKYVICIEAVENDFRNNKKTVETAPKFTLGNAQEGYETFIKQK